MRRSFVDSAGLSGTFCFKVGPACALAVWKTQCEGAKAQADVKHSVVSQGESRAQLDERGFHAMWQPEAVALAKIAIHLNVATSRVLMSSGI